VWQAAVAQPMKRDLIVPPPGDVDSSVGEFWIGNPWQFHDAKKNLSAYERNRVFLNHTGNHFFDVSHLTGADSDGDGRSTAIGDLNGDGMPEVIVRQVGGGTVKIYENQFPRQHYLQVSLRGTTSNSLGLGARLIAESGTRRLVREMFPANTFLAQNPSHVNFGLGDATAVERLVIQWPSGLEQVLEHVAADQHIEVTEGMGQPRQLVAR
jgi:hypothetical protein